MTNIIEVENKIITLRDQQVILDSDVAELYGVQTKEINQAVRNNPEKFPEGYIFELIEMEKSELVKIFDRFNRLLLSKKWTRRGVKKLYLCESVGVPPERRA